MKAENLALCRQFWAEFQPVGREPKRVLALAGCEQARARLTLLLGDRADLQLHQAISVQEGLEIAERFHPGLLLVDIGTACVIDAEWIAGLRARPWAGRLAVVALVDAHFVGNLSYIRAAGFDDYAEKPLDSTFVELVLDCAFGGHYHAAAEAERAGMPLLECA